MTLVDGMIYNSKALIPEPYCERTLKDIHTGHLGEVRCIDQARQVLWWPDLNEDIKLLVRPFGVCKEFRRTPREPLMPSSFPEQPLWRLAVDFFCYK